MQSALGEGYGNPYTKVRPTLAAAIMACFITGTGGIGLPHRYMDGTSIAPLFVAYGDYSVSRRLQDVLETYKLGKDQLASMLNISRPTLYAWLNDENVVLRTENKDRIERLTKVLESSIGVEPYSSLLGPFLRDHANDDGAKLWSLLTAGLLDQNKIGSEFRVISPLLEGQRRDQLLSDLLQNSSPVI